MARREIIQLSEDELCILRWLRSSNGQATVSASAIAGNSRLVVPDRLLKHGYIRTHTNSPETVHYILTESGLEALAICESTAYLAALARRASSLRRP
jgi:hypothetical protein